MKIFNIILKRPYYSGKHILYLFLFLFLLLFLMLIIINPNILNKDDNLFKTVANMEMIQDITYSDTLSEISTPLVNSSADRTDNIILACSKINETILMPDDIFSFNKSVGDRTKERGYKSAPSFVSGKIKESIGGGICQLSSTLYHACLLSDLQIISRTSHSMFPSYLDNPGLDATVCYGSIDFQFKNNTNSPIKILAGVEDTRVNIKIIGTKTSNNTVVIESNILSTTPYKTKYRDNLNLDPGQTKVIQPGFTGYVVDIYRVIKNENGEVIKRTFESKSTYTKLDEIIESNGKSVN